MEQYGEGTPWRHKSHSAGAGVIETSTKRKEKKNKITKQKKLQLYVSLKTKSGCPKKFTFLNFYAFGLFSFSIQHRDIKPVTGVLKVERVKRA